MKPLPLKIDNYLLERIDEEARAKRVTKSEIVRSALMHYLIHREDIADAQAIQSRLAEDDISAARVHLKIAGPAKKRASKPAH